MDRVAWFRRAALSAAVAVTAFVASQPAGAQLAARGSSAMRRLRWRSRGAALRDPVRTMPVSICRCAAPRASSPAGKPIKIVAIGSSSTAGAGASSAVQYLSEPARGRAGARVRRSRHHGDQPRRQRRRPRPTCWRASSSGVIAEKPDLVLWQVGTNSVLRDDPLAPHRSLLHDGIVRLKATGADVVLIDPQYAPKVIAKPNAEGMVELLEQTAQGDRRPVPALRGDAPLAPGRGHAVRDLPVARRTAHERLELRLRRQALGGAIAEAADPPGAVGHRAGGQALSSN